MYSYDKTETKPKNPNQKPIPTDHFPKMDLYYFYMRFKI